MFPGNKVKRIFLGLHSIDFRKGHDGILSEAYKLGLDILAGDGILFFSRDRKKLKVLFSDDEGLWLWCKKLHYGKNKYKFTFLDNPSCKEISVGEIGLIFEGASFTIHQRVKKWI